MTSSTFLLPCPVPRVHQGLPTGNSDSGFLIFGADNHLDIVFSLASFWYHRNGQWLTKPCPYSELVSLREPHDVDPVNRRLNESAKPFQFQRLDVWLTATHLSGGRMVLTLNAELKSLQLDYDTGLITAHTDRGDIRMLASLQQNSLLLDAPDGIIRKQELQPARLRQEKVYQDYNLPPVHQFSNGCFQPLPDEPGLMAWFTDRQFDLNLQNDDKIPTERKMLDFETVMNENRRFWKDFWNKAPQLQLPDPMLGQFFKLALYKFALATRPGGVPASLQGPWMEDYQRPPWSNDYHFNVNEQQIYTLAPALGACEHMLPLFDMLESPVFQRHMHENAKAMFDIDDGLLLTHAVTDRGEQCGGISAGSVLDFACGGWTALLYWMYYLNTDDVDFLRRRALPFMRGVMRVYESALRKGKDGSLELPLSISAEYGCTFPVKIDGKLCHQNSGSNPSNQLTCCHALANALLEAEKITGAPHDPQLTEIKEKLPRFSTVNGRVAIWDGQDLDVCHRHNSHLSMIYPFDLTGELTAEETEQVDQAVDHWIAMGAGQWSEWSYPWAMIIQTRWGMSESPAVLLETWKRLFLNESLATVYLPRFRGISAHRRDDMIKPKATNEIFQLDGTMGGATALLEMIVHEKAGVLQLLPGIPSFWPQLSFKNIHLSHRLVISGEVQQDQASFRLLSPTERTISFRVPQTGQSGSLHLQGGIPAQLTCRRQDANL